MKKYLLKKYMNMFSRINKLSPTWQGYTIARHAKTETERIEGLLSVARKRYEESKSVKLDTYFKTDLKEILGGKDVLEIGSNHGGASLAYFQLYELNSITGLDTSESQAEISNIYFEKEGVKSNYKFIKCYAEEIPFASENFDAIISTDVFEHVSDLSKVMNECFRLLRPGGKLLLVFPSYYHPTGHHLSIVSQAPCVHWFFSPQDIVNVFYDILDDNPDYRDRIGITRRPLAPWEKLPIINGTTLREFRRIIKENPWSEAKHISLPLGETGKLTVKYPFLKPLKYIIWLGTKLPLIEEVANHRIVYMITK